VTSADGVLHDEVGVMMLMSGRWSIDRFDEKLWKTDASIEAGDKFGTRISVESEKREGERL
jgi:hypothetical protein